MKKVLIILLLVLFPIIVLAYPKGDVDGNNKVGSADYVLVRKHILKQSSLTGDKLSRADMNGDGKITSLDYIAIRKIIINATATPTPTPATTTATATPTPVSEKKYTVMFVGGDIVTTGYEGNEVLIKAGKTSEHKSKNNNANKNLQLNLKKNQIYAVSFDYQTIKGSNEFDVDIYPDMISKSYPNSSSDLQVNLKATSTKQHYDWIFASNDDKIEAADVSLRFFDDIYDHSKDRSKTKEKDVTINNIVMSRVSSQKYASGEALGNLPTPSRKGYKFVGWYTSSTEGTKVTSTTQVTSDMTLYARWTGTYKHVFIIGIDGIGDTFRPDKQKTEPKNKVDAKNFRKIFSNYAYRYDALTENITISAQNWTSIFTGVSCETHGITNAIAGDKKNARTKESKNLSVFYYAYKQNPNAKFASIVNWNPINIGIIEDGINVKKLHPGDDTQVTNKTISYLEENKKNIPTIMFVHLCDVDHAAHATQKTCDSYGCGGYSKKYYDQAQVADGQLGKIYNKIESLGLMDNSLFIVVGDHGESKTSHGTKPGPKRDPEEEHVVVAVRGYSVNKMTLPATVHNRDVSAIVLYALGIDKPEHFISNVPAGLFNK